MQQYLSALGMDLLGQSEVDFTAADLTIPRLRFMHLLGFRVSARRVDSLSAVRSNSTLGIETEQIDIYIQ